MHSCRLYANIYKCTKNELFANMAQNQNVVIKENGQVGWAQY